MSELLKFVEEEEDEDEDEETFLVETSENGFGDVHDHELTDLEMQLLHENQVALKQQSQALLMDTHDDLRELWRTAKQVIQQVLVLIPKTEGIIPHEPVWHTIAEQMLQNLLESIEKPRYQLLTRLEQMQIKLIEPQQGESVNPSLHYVIDRISGGKEGTIARVVRVGYVQNQEVLRQAEVTIYH
jgi:molecular chaperone GrpE (heat shock protein)